MKKLVTAVSVAAVFASASAMAKTEGHYFGADLIRSEAQYQSRTNGLPTSGVNKFNSSVNGYGFDYRYAVNMDRVFVAPGVFYDKIDAKAIASNSDTVNIKSRYGVKLDVGYDVTDKVGLYFTNGFAETGYKVDGVVNGTGTKSKSDLKYYYGAGVTFNIVKNWDLRAEYTTQSFGMETAVEAVRVKARLNVMKFGVLYKF